MKADARDFFALAPRQQAEYLESEEFAQLGRKEKIQLLKSFLKEEPAAEPTASALRVLKQLNYPDRYYFRRFLYHPDSRVVTAAREAINQWRKQSNNRSISLVDMLREGKTSDRLLLVDYFLEEDGTIDEKTLISFLRSGDPKVREMVVRKVTQKHQLDDSQLCRAVTRGVTWDVRAALVEILGKRKSEHLFDIVDFLMKDSNVEVKLKLVAALTKVNMEKGKEYLKALAGDSFIWVRKEAKRALSAV